MKALFDGRSRSQMEWMQQKKLFSGIRAKILSGEVKTLGG